MQTPATHYNESQQICANYGGFLPEPRSEEENKFMTNLTPHYFWLGVTRGSGSTYVYQSDGADLVYAKWKSPPEGPVGLDGHTSCVARNYSQEVWIQVKCQQPAYGKTTSIVCQSKYKKVYLLFIVRK